MLEELIDKSEQLFKNVHNIYKFQSKCNVLPYKEMSRLFNDMSETAASIPDFEEPENYEQLLQSEIKRRLNGEAACLKLNVEPSHLDFETIVSIYGIPQSDLDGLRDWLVENKERTQDSIERLYKSKEIEDFELAVPLDIPDVRRQAEHFAAVRINQYHKNVGKLFQNLTKVGEFFRDIDAVSTTEERSYFHPLSEYLAISIPAICSHTKDKSLHIKEKNLIRIYGHEGMGHAMNHVVTKNSDLPYLLSNHSRITMSTMESVAQFYEKEIFEDLKSSHETQMALGIEHKFDEIYQDAKDVSQLEKYYKKLQEYAIIVMGDKGYGDPREKETLDRKKAELYEVSIDPMFALNSVEQNKYNFDSEGNLNPQLVSELIYSAQPVEKALEEFNRHGVEYKGEGRSKIDSTLLKGFWTPLGFVDYARLAAKES